MGMRGAVCVKNVRFDCVSREVFRTIWCSQNTMLSDCVKWGVNDLLLVLFRAPVQKVKVNVRSAHGLSSFLIGVALGSFLFAF